MAIPSNATNLCPFLGLVHNLSEFPAIAETRWIRRTDPVNQFPPVPTEKITEMKRDREMERERERERERGERACAGRVVNKSSFLPGFIPLSLFAISRLKPLLFGALVIRVSRWSCGPPAATLLSLARSLAPLCSRPVSVISRLAKIEKKEENVAADHRRWKRPSKRTETKTTNRRLF